MNPTTSEVSEFSASSGMQSLPEGTYIGQVLELDSKNRIRSVLSDQGKLIYISDQSTSVGCAAVHDQCIVLVSAGKAVVTNILLGDSSPFGFEIINGQLVVRAADHHGGIRVEAGGSTFELTADGRITLNGNQMVSRMQESLSLESRRINLDDIE
jgi:hypothetical protein